jgi:hypothetical protein
MTTNEILKLQAMATQLVNNLYQAADHIASLQAQLDTLAAAGMTTAAPTYRAGKYLYLVSPMIDGQRKREYIGNDPERIAAALEMIERQHQHDQLKARLDAYTSQLNRATWQLRDMVDSTNPKRK